MPCLWGFNKEGNMPKTLRLMILFLAVGAFAGVALAQSADYNTGGPTANTLQLRVTEPAEGATITGTQVRVGIAYNTSNFGEGQGTKFGEKDFPQPTFDVFLDNDLKQTVKGSEQNVVFIENVPAGAHKIVVMAKNVSGEVIDRKEINIVTTPVVAVEAAPAPPPPAPAPLVEAPAPPPPPAVEPPPAPAPAPMERETLPATGSAYPTVAVAGLALIAVGLSLARKVS
jgi:LPXTG-motif cell wall-anchored protein